MLRSILGLLVGSVLVRISLRLTKANGAVLKPYCGTDFYIAERHRVLIKSAMDQVVQFFGEDWPQYKGLIKSVLIDKDLSTTFHVGQRVVVIKETDTARMASPVHLAGWMIAYFQMLKTYRDNHCVKVTWKRNVVSLAREKAAEVRRQYLRNREPWNSTRQPTALSRKRKGASPIL